MKNDLLMLYKNYLYAMREREVHGEKYGDTEELIKNYEEELIKVTKNNKILIKKTKKHE